MTDDPFASWQGLFAQTTGPGREISLRELRRRGEVFLVLPSGPKAARATLALYPAQSPRARWLKRALALCLRVVPVVPGRRREICLGQADPFGRFLRETGGASEAAANPFGIYVGNGAPGCRRFIIALLDTQGRIRAIVKAGLGPGARALIERERSFLASVQPGTPGVPELRGQFNSDAVTAFAMEHVPGGSPRGIDAARLRAALAPWVSSEAARRFDEFPQAQGLAQCGAWTGGCEQVRARLAGARFAAVLSHGDFAPWNILVRPHDGVWTMVDWERGEQVGLPCWDWFHFMVQTEFLVRKARAAEVASQLDDRIIEENFRAYSLLAGAAGWERDLFLAYLLYVLHVIQPGEAVEQVRQLLHLLARRWFGGMT